MCISTWLDCFILLALCKACLHWSFWSLVDLSIKWASPSVHIFKLCTNHYFIGSETFMKLNEGKCHLLICWYKYEYMFAYIGITRIWEKYSSKFLGIHIDTDLSFQNYVRTLCKSAGKKISMIARIAKYLSVSKRKLLKWKHSLNLCLITVLWFGCFVVEPLT